jgi:VWFA-related protein
MSSWPTRVFLALIPAALAAQQTQPTFRAGVQLIEVDVQVTDEKGNVVRGLTKADFTILEDDAPQEIAELTFVDLPIEPRDERRADLKAAESDVATNTGEGRMYVLALNPIGEQGRLAARRFVEEAVGPNDQVAILAPLGRMTDAQGFTTNRHLMLDAIDRIKLAPTPVFGKADLISFDVVEDLINRMGRISGRRKVIVWFNPPSVFISSESSYFAQRDMLRAATRNNVAIYPVSTYGLTTGMPDPASSLVPGLPVAGESTLVGKAGIQVLAEETGGDVIVDSNNFTDGYQRFVRDNSSYYLLAYAPKVEHRDGKFHPLNVRVNRRGLTVRARRGYYAQEPDAPAVSADPDTDGSEKLAADTVRALGLPSSAGTLGIDLVATPFRSANGASVLVSAQLRGADLALGAGEPIELAYQPINTEGHQSRGAYHLIKLDLTTESRGAVLRRGLRVVDRLDVPAGRHQVRFAAHQPNGKTGSVLVDIDVPDYAKAPVTLSGVAIASAQSAGDRALLRDERLETVLGGAPTARRRFARGDVIAAYVEVYVGGSTLIRDVLPMAALETSTGRRLRGIPLVPTATQPGQLAFTARLPLADVSRGDYVLNIEARMTRQTVNRRVPFSVE